MTSARRHFVISRYHSYLHKLTKFNTHKLQVTGQHIDTPMSVRASRLMRARASKFKIAQNHFLNYFEYESGQVKHFENFRACVIAHTARTKHKNDGFWLDLTSDTFLSRFTNVQAIPTKNDVIRTRTITKKYNNLQNHAILKNPNSSSE